MRNATTVILPVGDLTSALAQKVSDSLGAADARDRTIVISLQWTARWSWDALCQLAAFLHARRRDTRVSFTRVAPAQRALLREVGLDDAWFADASPLVAAQRVLVSA
jgi:anti-anti-sigma regulatory factor